MILDDWECADTSKFSFSSVYYSVLIWFTFNNMRKRRKRTDY
jgi:hypothetical protein